MKKLWLSSLIVLFIISLTGCGYQTAQSPAAQSPMEGPYQEYGLHAPVAEESQVAKEMRHNAGSSDDQDEVVTVATTNIAANTDHKIIYNVYLHLIVSDTQETFAQLGQIARDMGGFVANSNTWKDGEQVRGTLTVRIPANNLDDALTRFRSLALDIESERVDSQDVTEEFVDLESRLTNLQRTEAELLELLESRSSTGKTSDILEVHRELTNIRAQIEQIQGRMKYLDNLSSLATVQITLTPDALMQPVVVGGWRPEGTARMAIRMLISTLQFFAQVVIFFVLYILPIAIVIAIPIVITILIIRAIWKRVKRRKQATKIA